MEFPFDQAEWKQILTIVYERAAVDHQFHVLCQRDPHAAIKLVCGKEIPATIHLRFESQKAEEMVLILPPENKLLFKPFTEKELAEIAAGMATVCAQLLSSQHRQTAL